MMDYLYRFPMGVTSHRLRTDFPDYWRRPTKVIEKLIVAGKAEKADVYGISVVRLTKAARKEMQEMDE
jgi:hypothetical protein